MNKDLEEAIDYVNMLNQELKNISDVDIVVCPSFVYLNEIKNILKNTNIKLGAQNVYFESKGAFTGEVSAEMIKSVGADYCIVGHSERRKYFNETDEMINKKAKKLLEYDITPIICVGENFEERESNKHFKVVKNQVEQALKNINKEMIINVIIAYEPIWAISTSMAGKCTGVQAEEMCKYIRQVVKELYNENISDIIRIQYGGNVNIDNYNEFLPMDNIDGALVGGASLRPEFADIVKNII